MYFLRVKLIPPYTKIVIFLQIKNPNIKSIQCEYVAKHVLTFVLIELFVKFFKLPVQQIFVILLVVVEKNVLFTLKSMIKYVKSVFN